LTKAGATAVEDFGGDSGADSIEIYEGPAGDYAIVFRDCNKCIAKVFIDNIPNYLTFRASVIAPQAVLSGPRASANSLCPSPTKRASRGVPLLQPLQHQIAHASSQRISLLERGYNALVSLRITPKPCSCAALATASPIHAAG
jgi:hypothetical protein